jgi:hypothetical protein
MEENDDALASDALSSLEERIHRTVELVSTLRGEGIRRPAQPAQTGTRPH